MYHPGGASGRETACQCRRGKESACNVGDPGLIPGLGRSPGEGNGYPLQCILAWRIPRTEEPDGPQSMGSQKSRIQLMAKQQQHTMKYCV